MREETEAERQRRLEDTRREIAAETARALEQIRSEVADLTLEATAIVVGKTLDADRDRELISDAIGSLDFSSWRSSIIAAAHRIYAEALFEAAKENERLAQVHEALADFAAAIDADARAARGAAEPAARVDREGDRSSPTSPATTSRCSRTSCSSSRRRAVRARSRRSRRSSSGLMAREERRLTVEVTTARELTDDEAKADRRSDRAGGGPEGGGDAKRRSRA